MGFTIVLAYRRAQIIGVREFRVVRPTNPTNSEARDFKALTETSLPGSPYSPAEYIVGVTVLELLRRAAAERRPDE